jgi:CO/xanthine dehydrogenase Mo-binding subunit
VTAERTVDLDTITDYRPAAALGFGVDDVEIVSAGTDNVEHDTGAYGSTGTFINPVQLRGPIEGGVVQAPGAAQFEHADIDETGRVTTRTLREYHVPVLADAVRDATGLRITGLPMSPDRVDLALRPGRPPRTNHRKAPAWSSSERTGTARPRSG